jgi:hypothetical protein
MAELLAVTGTHHDVQDVSGPRLALRAVLYRNAAYRPRASAQMQCRRGAAVWAHALSTPPPRGGATSGFNGAFRRQRTLAISSVMPGPRLRKQTENIAPNLV